MSVTIVVVVGKHPNDGVRVSEIFSVTVVWAIPHGTVVVSLTRWSVITTEHDHEELVGLEFVGVKLVGVGLKYSDEIFSDVSCLVEAIVLCCGGRSELEVLFTRNRLDVILKDVDRDMVCAVSNMVVSPLDRDIPPIVTALVGVVKLASPAGLSGDFGKSDLVWPSDPDCERPEGLNDVTRDAILSSFWLELEWPYGKEIVIVEVYETTTLTLTVPLEVMTRRFVLLDVFLVDVVSEEPCRTPSGDKLVGILLE